MLNTMLFIATQWETCNGFPLAYLGKYKRDWN